MSIRFLDRHFVGSLPPPKRVPSEGAQVRYRLSDADLSLSHGRTITRVAVNYTFHDGNGTAEVGYLYPVDTLILTASRNVLPVQFLRPGMAFLLADSGQAVVTQVAPPEAYPPPSPMPDCFGDSSGRVLGTVKFTGNYPRIDLHFDDGKIQTTPGHLFWCVRRKGWIPAKDFAAGDLMRSRKRRAIRVRAVSAVYWRNEPLYNLEVEDFHTYFVGNFGGDSVWTHNGLDFSCRVPKAAVVEAIEDGALRVVTPRQAGVVRPDRHHIFPQAFRRFFKERGVDIDRYTLQMDNMQGAHGALHFGGGEGVGGGWWNNTIMRELFKAESQLPSGDRLSNREILAIGASMRREAKLQHVKVVGYKD